MNELRTQDCSPFSVYLYIWQCFRTAQPYEKTEFGLSLPSKSKKINNL